MSQSAIIRVEDLSKKFRRYSSVAEGIKEVLHPLRKKYHEEFWALKNISFEVEKGESVGIVGRNGSGKSTLLQILCGVLQPTGGVVSVGGRVSALLELGAGFHTQFTGRENVYLSGALMGFRREEMDEKFSSIVEFADIGDFIDQPVRTYSSGMFVRLAFASAINVDPDILVVDEALAVGDMFFQAKCMARIKKMMDDGVTIFFVTHDLNTVKALCTKCLFLNKGRMEAFGPSGEVADMYLRNRSQAAGPGFLNPGAQSPVDVAAENDGQFAASRNLFKVDEDFMRRAEGMRHGSGEARITCVELLDEDGEPAEEVDFNQLVTIRIHVLFEKDAEFTVAYMVRDDKFIEILGSNTLLESDMMVRGRALDRFVADFKTRLPLQHGSYNIAARLTRPVVPNRTATRVDSVDNAVVFKMNDRQPYKVWSRVYLKNGFEISKEN